MKRTELLNRLILFLTILLVTFSVATANTEEELEKFEASLKFQSGEISVGDGVARFNLSDKFRYIDSGGAERVLVDAWGNPPESAEGNLGMIFPNNGVPAIESWAIVISYEEDGYVNDEGAEKIDYTAMAAEIGKAMEKANPERVEQGYPAMTFIGWAEPPHYDKENHKLYWAKEIKVAGASSNTLNYDIRVLGRRGVLVLEAIAAREQLQDVSENMERLLPLIEFNPGHRYSDFVPGTDKVAEYGISALVAGTLLAKVGFFKWLLILLLAAKKFIIIGLIAIGAMFKRLFFRKKEKETPTVKTEELITGSSEP